MEFPIIFIDFDVSGEVFSGLCLSSNAAEEVFALRGDGEIISAHKIPQAVKIV